MISKVFSKINSSVTLWSLSQIEAIGGYDPPQKSFGAHDPVQKYKEGRIKWNWHISPLAEVLQIRCLILLSRFRRIILKPDTAGWSDSKPYNCFVGLCTIMDWLSSHLHLLRAGCLLWSQLWARSHLPQQWKMCNFLLHGDHYMLGRRWGTSHTGHTNMCSCVRSMVSCWKKQETFMLCTAPVWLCIACLHTEQGWYKWIEDKI